MSARTVRRLAPPALAALAAALLAAPPAHAVHERWPIKTSVRPGADLAHPRKVALADLMTRPLEPGVRSDDPRYQDALIASPTADGLHEGDIVATSGWLTVVMRSADDSDYHVQLSTARASTSCFIVEIPKDARGYASAGVVRAAAAKERPWIRDQLVRGREPSTHGSRMLGPPYVRVVGQLFYDDAHLDTGPRGVRGQTARSLWELHPVVGIAFAPRPKP